MSERALPREIERALIHFATRAYLWGLSVGRGEINKEVTA